MIKIKKTYTSILSMIRFSQSPDSSNNGRVAKYDNLKGLAVFLVVLAHVLSPARDNTGGLYLSFVNFLAIFAMPVFLFVSGYLSKIGNDSAIKAFKNIFLPYILFAAIWIVFNHLILGRSLSSYSFVVPGYGLWFLFSLFLMRLFLPILVKVKYVLLLSIIFSLVLGIMPISEDFFSYSRTFCFLPVFLVGYYYNDYKKTIYGRIAKYKSILNLLKSKSFVFIMLILFIIIMSMFCMYISLESVFGESSFDIMQLNSPYEDMGLNILEGIITRFIVIISGIIGALFVNKLMTNKVTFLTKLGINSFAVYILHLYIVRFIFIKLRIDSPLEFIFNDPLLNGIYTVFMVSLICYILSRDFVTKKFNSLINIFVKVIMRH